MNSPEARDNQLRNLQSNAASEKEKQNEPKYRDLYTDLLRKYRSSLANKKQADSSTNPGFASENTLIKKVMDIERGSIIQGSFFGLTAFCTIRYLPHGMVHLMNGKKLLQTKNASKNSQGTFVRKTFAFLFEGSIGLLAGWRGYNMASSSQSKDIVEELSKIPLSEGRSNVSDTICSDWIDLTFKQIPSDFWHNLDTRGEEKTWRAAKNFANNCIKRDYYEKMLRKEKGLKPNEAVSIPKPGVPNITDIQFEKIINSERNIYYKKDK